MSSDVSPPVEKILGVWRFERPAGFHTKVYSLPGHLLHLILRGSYRLTSNGRDYHLKRNDYFYYHGSESVTWRGGNESVEFLSVGFLGGRLPPLALSDRKGRASQRMRRVLLRMARHSQKSPERTRDFHLFSDLYEILSELPFGAAAKSDPLGDRWWGLEEFLRREKIFRPALADLAEKTGMSLATLARSCLKATGLPPHKRIQIFRMEEARGLLAYSGMSVTEIAEALGYPRLHEFSREFSAFYKKSPVVFRREKKIRLS